MPTKKELKQRQAIPLFLLGKTDTEVAEAIGVSRQTIWKWRHEEDFDHDIVEAGEELLAQHTVAISQLVKQSITAMSELLKSADNNLKLKVALTVLSAATEWKRPQAPRHVAAEARLQEEQLDAQMRLKHWEQQYVAKGGRREDLMVAMVTGKFDPRAEFRAKIERIQNSTTGDTDSKPDDSGGTQ